MHDGMLGYVVSSSRILAQKTRVDTGILVVVVVADRHRAGVEFETASFAHARSHQKRAYWTQSESMCRNSQGA